MKKLISIGLLCIATGIINNACAQDVKTDVKKDAKAVKNTTVKDAKKVGNKTAELGSKAKSKVVDKTYAGKAGPDGQTIYIDKYSKYYWVDSKGHKNYVTKAELKDK